MGGRPFLVLFERVLFTSTFTVTDYDGDDDECDEGYCLGAKSKYQKKKKLRSSRVPSTSNLWSAKLIFCRGHSQASYPDGKFW